MSDEQQQRDTIERIAESPFLGGSRYGPKLLRYLFEKRDERVSEKDIAVDVFEARTDKQVAGGNARQHCKSLRDALQAYAEAALYDDVWRFFLPEQTGSEGYQLQAINLRGVSGAVHAFWRAHLKPVRPVVIVSNEPLFYRDESASAIVAVREGEDDCSNAAGAQIDKALDDLKGKSTGGKVYPCQSFALSGEIGARDRLAEWFSKSGGLKAGSRVSRHMNTADDIAEWSPILLGSRLTNKILREVSEWYQFERFCFHVSGKGSRTVEIRNPTAAEKDFLTEKYDDADESDEGLVLYDNPVPDQVVFATVTRLPNHFNGENAITILSANYERVLEQVAYVLTDEQTLKALFVQAGWSLSENAPRYFEWLFSVRLGRHHADDLPAKPKLRACRKFERFAEYSSARA